MKDHTWLDAWVSQIDPHGEVLELGCDTGRDTYYLVNQGLKVTATDISEEALEHAGSVVPEAQFIRHDLQDPFPFSDHSFSTVLASLCLHYFDWKKTREIVSEIYRCLSDNGLLICRLNSVNDKFNGSIGIEEIEPNYYRANGRYSVTKRFFDLETIEALFCGSWTFVSVGEKTIDRYEHTKVIWEVILRKSAKT